MSNKGSMAYDWKDKPHRVVYALCRQIEFMTSQLQHVLDSEVVDTCPK